MLLPIRVWRKQPGKYFCLATALRLPGATKVTQWEDHFFKRADFDDIEEFVEANLDKEIYFCPHGFNKARRLKQYAVAPQLLYADLDESNPSDLGDLTPTFAWETSPERFAGIWLLNDDGFYTEDLNQRLSYKIKADPGGWDLTQVLRVPGSLNHKYSSNPRVRLLWTDGGNFDVKEIEKLVGVAKPKKKADVSTEEPLDIYKRYSSHLPGWVRRELFTKKRIAPGKRSEMLWKLNRTMQEAGMSEEEIFELLRISPWNKFKDRRNGDEQLQHEISKANEQVIKGLDVVADEREAREKEDETEEDDTDDGQFRLVARSMDKVEEENVDWLWPGYLARGMVSMLEGDPGLGKSYAAMMIAKGVCDGLKLPGMTTRTKPAKVVYCDLENSAQHVTKKRLAANGLVNTQNYIQVESAFALDNEDHIEALYELVEHHRPALLVIDPIGYYTGSGDTHKASEVVQMLAPLIGVAQRFQCAVLVCRHLTKNTKTSALYRGQGSIAFAGGVRIAMTAGYLPGEPVDGWRGIVQIKNNIGEMVKGALTFMIESIPDTDQHKGRSRLVWGDVVDMTANDVLSHEGPSKGEEDKASSVIQFLQDLLNDGKRMPEHKVKRAADARSLSMKSLRKHAEAAGVTIKSGGFGGVKEAQWKLKPSGDEK